MTHTQLPDGTSLPLIGLGTYSFGGGRSADTSQDDEMVQIINQLIAMGYNHLDTAESYGNNHCEELVGRALQSHPRQDIFVTTKVSPEHLRYADVHNSLDNSLKRLGTDYVDLYLIHWPNRDIPLAETMQALNEAVADGRTRRVGVSNFDRDLLQEAHRLCDSPLATNQVHYNLLHRNPQANGVLDYCQEHGILLTAYSPLKDSVLSNTTVQKIAKNHGVSAAQVALRWLIDQPQVVTIPKTSDLEHAHDNLAALQLELTNDEKKRLNELNA